MGIPGINNTLKEHSPEAFGTIPLSYFAGSAIAIDGNEYTYSCAATIIKNMYNSAVDPLLPLNRGELFNRLCAAIVSFSSVLMKNSITPVWCWDGEAPAEKAYIRDKRYAAKVKLRARITEARQYLEQLHPLMRTGETVAAYKKLISQDTTVNPTEMNLLAEFVRSLGIPSLKAEGEAEKLCAALAIEQIVKGVWSEDTDAYALGTPLLITGFDKPGPEGQRITAVSLPHILYGVSRSFGWQFSQNNLVDLCILHGTDFNSNMSQIGPKKSVGLIKKYGTIENISLAEPTKPISTLNHQRTREIFSYVPSGYTVEHARVNNDMLRNCNDILMERGCSELYHGLWVRIVQA